MASSTSLTGSDDNHNNNKEHTTRIGGVGVTDWPSSIASTTFPDTSSGSSGANDEAGAHRLLTLVLVIGCVLAAIVLLVSMGILVDCRQNKTEKLTELTRKRLGRKKRRPRPPTGMDTLTNDPDPHDHQVTIDYCEHQDDRQRLADSMCPSDVLSSPATILDAGNNNFGNSTITVRILGDGHQAASVL